MNCLSPHLGRLNQGRWIIQISCSIRLLNSPFSGVSLTALIILSFSGNVFVYLLPNPKSTLPRVHTIAIRQTNSVMSASNKLINQREGTNDGHCAMPS